MKKLIVVSWIVCLLTLAVTSCLGAETVSGKSSGITVTNVVDYGAVANDSKDDTAAVNAAINSCANGDTKTLYFPGGTFNLAAVNFPATINVVMANGALLETQSGATIIFNGPFTAGLYQVFSGAGNVQFGNGAVNEVYPQWWYASGDASPAINKAISSSPLSPGIQVRLSGIFDCQTTIHIKRNRVKIVGDGMHATLLKFNPAVSSPLFEFSEFPGENKGQVVQCGIADLAIFGGREWGDKSKVQKVGIRIVNADTIEVRNVAIQNWSGTNSIGLQIQGRQLGFIENILISADLPISIEKNPAYEPISIDHFTFRNSHLLSYDPNGAYVKIASGVKLSNVVFDGTHAWAGSGTGGKYGIYWEDTETPGPGMNLSVKNVRMECGTPGGEIIHISHNYVLYNLVLENIFGCSGGPGGVYLRKVHNATLQNIFYTSDKPGTASLDIDESSANIVLINCRWDPIGLVKTGKLVKTFATNVMDAGSGPNNRIIEVYDRPNNYWGDSISIYGTNTWSYNGELDNGAAISLPALSASKVATITVSVSDGSAITESGCFVVSAKGNTVKKVSGTDSVAVTSSAGKLCLVPGTKVQLINNLGAKVDVVITIDWR